MGEPLLRKLYEAGVRDLIVRPASGGDYVTATKGLRVRLPNGQQAGAIAQTDINGPTLSMLITQDGRGLVWCGTAGKTVNARTPELVRSRPQEVIAPALPSQCLVAIWQTGPKSFIVSTSLMESPLAVVVDGPKVPVPPGFEFHFQGNSKGEWAIAYGGNTSEVGDGNFPVTMASGNSTSYQVETINVAIPVYNGLASAFGFDALADFYFGFISSSDTGQFDEEDNRLSDVRVHWVRKGGSTSSIAVPLFGEAGALANPSQYTFATGLCIARNDFAADGVLRGTSSRPSSFVPVQSFPVSLDTTNGFRVDFRTTSWSSTNKLYKVRGTISSSGGTHDPQLRAGDPITVDIADFDRDNLTIITDANTPTLTASVAALDTPSGTLRFSRYYDE